MHWHCVCVCVCALPHTAGAVLLGSHSRLSRAGGGGPYSLEKLLALHWLGLSSPTSSSSSFFLCSLSNGGGSAEPTKTLF